MGKVKKKTKHNIYICIFEARACLRTTTFSSFLPSSSLFFLLVSQGNLLKWLESGRQQNTLEISLFRLFPRQISKLPSRPRGYSWILLLLLSLIIIVIFFFLLFCFPFFFFFCGWTFLGEGNFCVKVVFLFDGILLLLEGRGTQVLLL